MTEYIVKKEDSLPVFSVTLGDDVSTADEVRLYVENATSGDLIVNDVMTIDNAADGSVSYNFDANQTALVGYHQAEVVVTTNGEARSYPNKGYYTFEFTEPLDRTANVDAAEAGGTFDASKLTMRGDIVDDNGNVVYDYSLSHVPQTALENDSVTVNAGTNLTGGGTVSLGGSVTLDAQAGYTDEDAQDAVGTILTNDFVYDDATPSIDLASGSVTTDELDESITPTWTGSHGFQRDIESGDTTSALELDERASVGDTGKVQVSRDAAAHGYAMIQDTTNDEQVLVALGGASNTVEIIHQSTSGTFTTTEDNDGTVNVYWDATNGRYELNNETGASATFAVELLKA